MTYTNGYTYGGPYWFEQKKDGTRYSYEYSDETHIGISRVYNNDKDTINISSTTNKQLAPGWLYFIENNRGKLGKVVKNFQHDGNIMEVECDGNGKPINIFEWKLKEDGTHDKIKKEIVVRKKEGSEEEYKEVIETFICNEKNY